MPSRRVPQPFYIPLTGPGHTRACLDIVLFPKKQQDEGYTGNKTHAGPAWAHPRRPSLRPPVQGWQPPHTAGSLRNAILRQKARHSQDSFSGISPPGKVTKRLSNSQHGETEDKDQGGLCHFSLTAAHG